MAFNSHSSQTPMAEINVTPLVDVMLVLLVVFIVTAPLLTQAIKVNLPQTKAAAPRQEAKTLQLTIDAGGNIFIDRQPLTLAELPGTLRQARLRHQDTGVQLSADEQVPYGRVARVMAEIQHAGINKIAFVTVPIGAR